MESFALPFSCIVQVCLSWINLKCFSLLLMILCYLVSKVLYYKGLILSVFLLYFQWFAFDLGISDFSTCIVRFASLVLFCCSLWNIWSWNIVIMSCLRLVVVFNWRLEFLILPIITSNQFRQILSKLYSLLLLDTSMVLLSILAF